MRPEACAEDADEPGASMRVESLRGTPDLVINTADSLTREANTLQAIENLRIQQLRMFKELQSTLESWMMSRQPTGDHIPSRVTSGEVLPLLTPSGRIGGQSSLTTPREAHLRPTPCERLLSAGTNASSQEPYQIYSSNNEMAMKPRKKSIVKIVPQSAEAVRSDGDAAARQSREHRQSSVSARVSEYSAASARVSSAGENSEELPLVVKHPTSLAHGVRKTMARLGISSPLASSAGKELPHGKSSRIVAFEDAEKEKKDRANLIGRMHQGTLDPQVPVEETPVSRAKAFIRGHNFDVICACVVTAHAIVIAAQINYLYKHRRNSNDLLKLDIAFAVIYIIELLCRLWGSGPTQFFIGRDRLWNIGDAFIISLSVFYLMVEEAGPTSLNFVRIIRTLRVVRVVRIVRITRFFKQLRMLVYAIASTLKTCMWTILMMVVVVYLFTLIISQSVASYFADDEAIGIPITESELEDLKSYFGSLEDTAFTLYMSISGGIDWEVAVDPLFKIGSWVGALFLLYITFMIICVMNLMTGIFVESAIDAAQSDREHLVQNQLMESARYKKELQELFEQWDVSGDQQLTLEEFQRRLEEPRVLALYKSLEIDPSDAWSFFKLLDKDGSGFVDLEEFIDGCIRLKGKATGFHMERIAYENKWLMEMLAKVSLDVTLLSESVVARSQGQGDLKDVHKSVLDLQKLLSSGRSSHTPVVPLTSSSSGAVNLPKGEPKEMLISRGADD